MSSALRRLPIRWRLAGTSAVLTLVILCAFAIAVGELTTRRIRSDFDNQIAAQVSDLKDRVHVEEDRANPGQYDAVMNDDPDAIAGGQDAVIRVVGEDGSIFSHTNRAPNLGLSTAGLTTVNGFRVGAKTKAFLLKDALGLPFKFQILVQYARRVSDMEATISKVQIFLLFGVLGGTALAFFAGLMIARRAMAPIATLTSTAREIGRTRDPSRRIPQPKADDEVAELARTLDEMLQALDAARGETEATLARQRRFVADASHELRTPLTSVLANLELLADTLDGEQGDAASSALRSSRRMRRLVADLLLLARADVGRSAAHEPTDLAGVVVEAAAELEPVADGHEVTVDADPAVVKGARDELHRLAVNLIENAIRHNPRGTQVRASTSTSNGHAVLTVEDDGVGIPPEIASSVFERFVRGEGERAGSAGLGLAIVRAVAQSHGGTVSLERPATGHGARFVVRLPAAPDDRPAASPPLVATRAR
jgi:two-component system, OmpR family, sensor kinase